MHGRGEGVCIEGCAVGRKGVEVHPGVKNNFLVLLSYYDSSW
jgi:hypothetical protein